MTKFNTGDDEEGSLMLIAELSQSWLKTFKLRQEDKSINSNGHSVLSLCQEVF